MNKKISKILSLLLALCMFWQVVFIAPLSAYATAAENAVKADAINKALAIEEEANKKPDTKTDIKEVKDNKKPEVKGPQLMGSSMNKREVPEYDTDPSFKGYPNAPPVHWNPFPEDPGSKLVYRKGCVLKVMWDETGEPEEIVKPRLKGRIYKNGRNDYKVNYLNKDYEYTGDANGGEPTFNASPYKYVQEFLEVNGKTSAPLGDVYGDSSISPGFYDEFKLDQKNDKDGLTRRYYYKIQKIHVGGQKYILVNKFDHADPANAKFRNEEDIDPDEKPVDPDEEDKEDEDYYNRNKMHPVEIGFPGIAGGVKGDDKTIAPMVVKLVKVKEDGSEEVIGQKTTVMFKTVRFDERLRPGVDFNKITITPSRLDEFGHLETILPFVDPGISLKGVDPHINWWKYNINVPTKSQIENVGKRTPATDADGHFYKLDIRFTQVGSSPTTDKKDVAWGEANFKDAIAEAGKTEGKNAFDDFIDSLRTGDTLINLFERIKGFNIGGSIISAIDSFFDHSEQVGKARWRKFRSGERVPVELAITKNGEEIPGVGHAVINGKFLNDTTSYKASAFSGFEYNKAEQTSYGVKVIKIDGREAKIEVDPETELERYVVRGKIREDDPEAADDELMYTAKVDGCDVEIKNMIPGARENQIGIFFRNIADGFARIQLDSFKHFKEKLRTTFGEKFADIKKAIGGIFNKDKGAGKVNWKKFGFEKMPITLTYEKNAPTTPDEPDPEPEPSPAMMAYRDATPLLNEEAEDMVDGDTTVEEDKKEDNTPNEVKLTIEGKAFGKANSIPIPEGMDIATFKNNYHLTAFQLGDKGIKNVPEDADTKGGNVYTFTAKPTENEEKGKDLYKVTVKDNGFDIDIEDCNGKDSIFSNIFGGLSGGLGGIFNSVKNTFSGIIRRIFNKGDKNKVSINTIWKNFSFANKPAVKVTITEDKKVEEGQTPKSETIDITPDIKGMVLGKKVDYAKLDKEIKSDEEGVDAVAVPYKITAITVGDKTIEEANGITGEHKMVKKVKTGVDEEQKPIIKDVPLYTINIVNNDGDFTLTINNDTPKKSKLAALKEKILNKIKGITEGKNKNQVSVAAKWSKFLFAEKPAVLVEVADAEGKIQTVKLEATSIIKSGATEYIASFPKEEAVEGQDYDVISKSYSLKKLTVGKKEITPEANNGSETIKEIIKTDAGNKERDLYDVTYSANDENNEFSIVIVNKAPGGINKITDTIKATIAKFKETLKNKIGSIFGKADENKVSVTANWKKFLLNPNKPTVKVTVKDKNDPEKTETITVDADNILSKVKGTNTKYAVNLEKLKDVVKAETQDEDPDSEDANNAEPDKEEVNYEITALEVNGIALDVNDAKDGVVILDDKTVKTEAEYSASKNDENEEVNKAKALYGVKLEANDANSEITVNVTNKAPSKLDDIKKTVMDKLAGLKDTISEKIAGIKDAIKAKISGLLGKVDENMVALIAKWNGFMFVTKPEVNVVVTDNEGKETKLDATWKITSVVKGNTVTTASELPKYAKKLDAEGKETDEFDTENPLTYNLTKVTVGGKDVTVENNAADVIVLNNGTNVAAADFDAEKETENDDEKAAFAVKAAFDKGNVNVAVENKAPSKLDQIKKTIKDKLAGIKDTISEKIAGIKDAIKAKISSIFGKIDPTKVSVAALWKNFSLFGKKPAVEVTVKEAKLVDAQEKTFTLNWSFKDIIKGNKKINGSELPKKAEDDNNIEYRITEIKVGDDVHKILAVEGTNGNYEILEPQEQKEETTEETPVENSDEEVKTEEETKTEESVKAEDDVKVEDEVKTEETETENKVLYEVEYKAVNDDNNDFEVIVTNMQEKKGGIFDKIKGIFGGIFGKIKGVMSGIIEKVKGIFGKKPGKGGIFGKIKGIISGIFGKIKDIFGKIFGGKKKPGKGGIFSGKKKPGKTGKTTGASKKSYKSGSVKTNDMNNPAAALAFLVASGAALYVIRKSNKKDDEE